jgi:hypothetical protein
MKILNKPLFVKCSVDVYISHGDTYYNVPTNLLLCKSIEKVNRKTSTGCDYYIKFVGCDVTWRFETEKERDVEYKRLMEII